MQAESEAEAWRSKVAKAKEGEKTVFEQLQIKSSEITKLSSQANTAKSRIAELEVALKENQAALEAVRAEVEVLRGEASVSGFVSIALYADIAGGGFYASGAQGGRSERRYAS